MACANPLTAERLVMLQGLWVQRFLRCEKKPGKPPRRESVSPVGWWNTGSSTPDGLSLSAWDAYGILAYPPPEVQAHGGKGRG